MENKAIEEIEVTVQVSSKEEEKAMEDLLKVGIQMKVEDSTREFNVLFARSLGMLRINVGIGTRKLM